MENEEKWGIDDGKLMIMTEPGGIHKKETNLKNQFILDRPLPKGDF